MRTNTLIMKEQSLNPDRKPLHCFQRTHTHTHKLAKHTNVLPLCQIQERLLTFSPYMVKSQRTRSFVPFNYATIITYPALFSKVTYLLRMSRKTVGYIPQSSWLSLFCSTDNNPSTQTKALKRQRADFEARHLSEMPSHAEKVSGSFFGTSRRMLFGLQRAYQLTVI